MRPMFFDFYEDEVCYTLEDQYMFGEDILFAPVTERGQRERQAYLPKGRWMDVNSGKVIDGPCRITCQVPLEKFAAFVKEGSQVAEVFGW